MMRRDWVETEKAFECPTCGYSVSNLRLYVNFCGDKPAGYRVGDDVPPYWVLLERDGRMCFAVHLVCEDCGRDRMHGVGYVKDGKIEGFKLPGLSCWAGA